jgi:hypothetical protein
MRYLVLQSLPVDPSGLCTWEGFCSLFNAYHKGSQFGLKETRIAVCLDRCWRYEFARAGDFVVWRTKRRSFTQECAWDQWHEWCFMPLPDKAYAPFVRLARDLSWANRVRILSCMGCLRFNPEAKIAVCTVKRA